MKPLAEQYDPAIAEKNWQKTWEKQGIHHWDETLSRADTYVIDTPPPTVSGLLHMGHIFSYTQADFMARYKRMSGKTVFYPMGFDDNGLPTERLVEKVKKVRPAELGREKFIEVCEGVAEEARKEFRELFQSIALSVDWRQEYHTISPECRRISQMSFLDLLKKEQAYRKLQPMLWDPVDQTAIAQAEVEDKEIASHANIIPFGIVTEGADAASIKWGEIEKVQIMTTRPELLGACVALMCHPDDAEKYSGKSAVTPIFGVVVPIVADEKVDKEKGTGLVMCCTFGDETDIHWQKKHALESRVILNKYGKLELKDKAWLKPEKNRAWCSVVDEKWAILQGLKVNAAREKTIEILKELNCLLEQKPITHAVKCAERSGAPLEFLETNQWFVKVLEHKEALKAKAAECVWYPPYMKVRVDQWIDGLSWDWCISRQRYFGVPFPVWYSKRAGEEGKVLFATKEQLPVNPIVDLPVGYTRDEVEPEFDVMDTWATSSVSPQINSHAITKEFADDWDRHQKLFPADVRPQAHEIIRTWAFYTIVKAFHHGNTIPWKNLMISGWCLAADRSKMSKSKGNVVTPIDLIEGKGADVVRYWASTSKLGADTAFSEDVLKIGKKLVNKLWNATKFAAIHLDKLQGTPKSAREEMESGVISEVLDQWILTRLHRAIAKATAEFENYEYSDARAAAEDFFWNDFCDNYLELVKARIYGNEFDAKAQMSAVHTMYHCLNGLLRLFAPFVPHVTEELYSHIFDKEYEKAGSLHARGSWPKASDYPVNADAEQVGIDCVSILNAIRKQKSERNVSIKFPIETLSVFAKNYKHKELLVRSFTDLKGASNAADVQWSEKAFDVTVRAQTGATDNGTFTVNSLFSAESDVA